MSWDLFEEYRQRCRREGIPAVEGDGQERVTAGEIHAAERAYVYVEPVRMSVNEEIRKRLAEATRTYTPRSDPSSWVASGVVEVAR